MDYYQSALQAIEKAILELDEAYNKLDDSDTLSTTDRQQYDFLQARLSELDCTAEKIAGYIARNN